MSIRNEVGCPVHPVEALGTPDSAADPISLPKLKPRAMSKLFVVPAIGSGDVACARWPDIRRFEHFLLMCSNLVNYAFSVHASQ